ncbi:MAG: calcium channel protein [Bogoriella megaspora]|nr:MAG: calcium channel protein [Bogoriella megaspora]
MASNGPGHGRNRSTPQSIPLQTLNRPPDSPDGHGEDGQARPRSLTERGRNILRHSPSLVNRGFERRYAPIAEGSTSPTRRSGDSWRAYTTRRRSQGQELHEEDDDVGHTPIDDLGGFQDAIGFAGLSFQGESDGQPGSSRAHERPWTPERTWTSTSRPYTPSSHQDVPPGLDDNQDPLSPDYADTTPLTEPRNLQAFAGTDPTTPSGQRHDRSSFHSVRFLTPEQNPPADLADDANSTEAGLRRPHTLHVSAAHKRSLSPTANPLARAGTMVRKMSQRVVNLGNEPEVVQHHIRRKSSGKQMQPEIPPVPPIDHHNLDGSLPSPGPASEKLPTPTHTPIKVSHDRERPRPDSNPLRGRSLGVFPPENPIRRKLFDLLVHPLTEPFILVLIVIQTVLLAVDSGKTLFDRDEAQKWGSRWIDFCLLVLFSIYTVEIVIRVIVSGLIINPSEYSTINREIGFRQAIYNKASDLFSLQRKPSVRNVDPLSDDTPQQSIIRKFTMGPSIDPDIPGSYQEKQRYRLAHRAFLRHSFNRLDFLAVCSFWISFVLDIFSLEWKDHFYLFRMLACLRILRLLGLTSGTSVILRSLKRAAPTLLNVAFLIGFFWLLFAVVGVQSFKSSLRRTCVWVPQPDSAYQQNYTQNETGNFQFCGGWYEDDLTEQPWLTADGRPGASSAKGYLCPKGSRCVEGGNPYNGTVSFDNIGQSLELVFVIMSSNTFSDLLYYLTQSDYLIVAIFFALAIVILSLWLISLLIAVITSSFQVIREESKTSAFTAEERNDIVVHEDHPLKRVNPLKKLYKKSEWVWVAIIVYGLVAQCLRTSHMTHGHQLFVDISETIVTILLLIEIIIRLAVDWRHFFYKPRNIVDFSLAVITTIIQIPQIHDSGQPYAWLTIFQILRIYRVVLAVPLTRDLIMIVFRHVSGLTNLILFVFLLTFLVSIFAVQMFRGQIPAQDSQGNTIQINFSTIYNSFLGMYQVLSSENWTAIMYNATNYEYRYKTAWMAAAFFILWFILANFIVLNMFIAVIQENFDVSEDEKRMQQVKAFLQHKELGGSSHGNLSLSSIFKLGQFRRQDPLDFGSAATEMLLKDAVVRDFLDEEANDSPHPEDADGTGALNVTNSRTVHTGPVASAWFALVSFFKNADPNPFYSKLQLNRTFEEHDTRAMVREVVTASERRKREQRDYLRRHKRYNVSLFVFSPNNPVRRACQRMVGPGRGERIEGVAPSIPVWYAFSAFIYAAIVAMVVLACVTTPLYQKEYFNTHKFDIKNWFVFSDMGFAALFTVEAVIKVIADGFFFSPNAYFRSSWGFLDGIVLITLWINVVTSLLNEGAVSRAVGAFKALRALRLLNVSDSARDTFHSVIILGGWKVVSAAFVSLSLLIPFAIYGLNIFNGRLMSCNDTSMNFGNLTDCTGEYLSSPYGWNVLAPRQVSNSYYDFDDFGGSLFILFQIVSQEGWIDVMNSAQSITGVFTQPQSFASKGNAVFFVIFNLLGSVFVLTLFVSVFMRNYTEQTGVAFLTTDQRSWLELRKLLRQVSPSKRPSSTKKRESWEDWCYRRAITKGGRWQRSITFILITHLILLCLEFYPSVKWWDYLRDSIFFIFTLIYMSNLAIRIVGLTWTRFRKSSWDVYALFVVTGSFVFSILVFSEYDNRAFQQIHKLFLVGIALLLIPRNNQLDQLFKTAAASLGSIANLMATWFVLFLLWAIALTQTFGLTRFNSFENVNLNFRSVPKALILLFRTSMGEGWNQIMEDFATVTPPFCVVGEKFYDGDCGSPEWARALFILWNILSMYIFVNLFVSLIYESFSYVYQRSSGLSVISREEIRRFKQAWAEFDPHGTGYISKEVFPRFLGELSGIFEMRIYDGDFTIGRLVEDCKIQHRESGLPLEGAPGPPVEIDLNKLRERLARLPVAEIRRRRERMNQFYEEVLVSADPDRGISFNALLMILAHYKVINDNKSLRLEEFLRRRARLQRVEEAVRRNVVIGFFDTVYWARKFRRNLEARNLRNMNAIPHFTVPEIFVDEDGDGPHTEQPSANYNEEQHSPEPFMPSPILSPQDRTVRAVPGEGPISPPIISPPLDTSVAGTRARSSSIQISPSNSPTRPSSLQVSPQLTPRHRPRSSGDWQFAEALTGPSSPIHSRFPSQSQGYGEGPSGLAAQYDTTHQGRSRSNTNVSAQEVLDVLDNSAWGESIRRSFTLRRSSPGRER